MLTLLLRFWKPLAGLVVLATVGLWAVHEVRSYGQHQKEAGRGEVQALWDAAVQARRVQDESDAEANRKNNAEAETKHAQALADIAADRDFARRLLLAAKGGRDAAQEAARVIQADAATSVARSQSQADAASAALREAITGYDQACRADVATLQALQDEVRPWVTVE